MLKIEKTKKSLNEECGDVAFTELGEVRDDDLLIIHKDKDLLND